MSAEILLTLFIAIIVFGPTKLPMLARHLGLVVKKIQQLKQQVFNFWQQQIHESQLVENQRKAKEADNLYEIKEDS